MTLTSNELVYRIKQAATELELKEVIDISLSSNMDYDKIKFITLTIILLRVHQTEQHDPNALENIAVAIELLKIHRQQFLKG